VVRSSAASDVYKRQGYGPLDLGMFKEFLGAIPAPPPVPVATPPKP
jgi:hypothetical protein